MAGLSLEARFGLLVYQHWTWRENQTMSRRLKKPELDAEPCVEDIDGERPRGLDRAHWELIVAADFFTVEVWSRRGLQRHILLFFLDLSTRKVENLGCSGRSHMW